MPRTSRALDIVFALAGQSLNTGRPAVDPERNVREHATASTRTRAGVANDVEPFLFRYLACDKGAVGFERVHSSHVVALLVP